MKMGINVVFAVTDGDWFQMLRRQPELGEVNFWAPSASATGSRAAARSVRSGLAQRASFQRIATSSTDQLHLPRKPTVEGVGREIVPVGRQGFELRQHSGIQKRRKSGVSKLRTKWAQS
jgi:hypothetical protein